MNKDTGTEKETTGKRRIRQKGKTNKKRVIITILCVLAAVLIFAAALSFFLWNEEKKQKAALVEVQVPIEEQQKPVATPEPEAENPPVGEDVLAHMIAAADMVDEVYKQRPPSVEVTEANAADFATISSCVIGEGSKVQVTVESDKIPISDDKYYYLFAIDTFDTTIGESDESLDKVYKDSEMHLSANLNYNTSSSRLFDKFVVAVKKDGKYVQVSRPKYITNPEAIARYSSVYMTPASIKGVLVDPHRLRGGELDDLGVKQAAYNIPIARLLGQTTSPNHPTIYYTYNGRTYAINGQIVAEYDIVFGNLTAKGITTTAILLNNYSSSQLQLIHPNARSGSQAPYYMFNAAQEDGVECMAAVATFLAERYSNNTHGRISNWVIANEINARKEWNHYAHVDIETYVEEYAKGFRVFYNAIKSVSSSARIYMPIDQQWDRNLKNNPDYDGKDIVDTFSRNIKSKGDIDWGLSQHPYNVPLTEPRIWKGTKYVTHSTNSSFISMDNIEYLTSYMEQDYLLNPKGEVRSIILSEQGYTSTSGEALQAAAFAYAYYKADNNPHIDAFLLNRQTDAPEEVAQGLAFGLNHSNGVHKQIYNVFKYIDTPQHAQYTDFAKGIIGISSWSEIY